MEDKIALFIENISFRQVAVYIAVGLVIALFVIGSIFRGTVEEKLLEKKADRDIAKMKDYLEELMMKKKSGNLTTEESAYVDDQIMYLEGKFPSQ